MFTHTNTKNKQKTKLWLREKKINIKNKNFSFNSKFKPRMHVTIFNVEQSYLFQKKKNNNKEAHNLYQNEISIWMERKFE